MEIRIKVNSSSPQVPAALTFMLLQLKEKFSDKLLTLNMKFLSNDHLLSSTTLILLTDIQNRSVAKTVEILS